MTISNTDNTISFLGNDVTTVFAFSFRVDAAAHLQVTLLNIAANTESAPISASLYTVVLNGVSGGTVEYPLTGDPLSANYKINIRRVVPYTQGLDLDNQGSMFPEALETQLDQVVMQIQQIAEAQDRSVQIPLGSTDDPQTLIDAIVALSLDIDSGTWTPAPKFGGAAVGMTGVFTGFWRTVGKIWVIGYNLQFTALGSSTGEFTLEDLPAIVSTPSAQTPHTGSNLTGLTTVPFMVPEFGTTYARLKVWGAAGTTQLTHAVFTNTTLLNGMMIYTAA